MSIFLDWFLGKIKSVKPGVTTKPAAPPTAPVPTTPSNSGTTIKIEDWNDTVGGWLEMPVPFKSVAHMHVRTIGGVWGKTRVTVLSGVLSVTGTSVSGPHNPSISQVKGMYSVGQSFVVECALGAPTNNRAGGWDMCGYGVKTSELGQIIQLGAQVVYSG